MLSFGRTRIIGLEKNVSPVSIISPHRDKQWTKKADTVE